MDREKLAMEAAHSLLKEEMNRMDREKLAMEAAHSLLKEEMNRIGNKIDAQKLAEEAVHRLLKEEMDRIGSMPDEESITKLLEYEDVVLHSVSTAFKIFFPHIADTYENLNAFAGSFVSPYIEQEPPTQENS